MYNNDAWKPSFKTSAYKTVKCNVCQWCRGKGTQLVTIDDSIWWNPVEETVSCPSCKGTGKVKPYSIRVKK